MIEYKVITDGSPNELWASGFYGDAGRDKAESMVKGSYWRQFMYEKDKYKTLVVMPVRS